MQRISRDDCTAANANYRQTAGGDVAVDGSSPKARRLTGLINAVGELRGVKLIVPHVLVPIVHRRPYAHRVGKAFMGHDLRREGRFFAKNSSGAACLVTCSSPDNSVSGPGSSIVPAGGGPDWAS